MHYSSTLSSEDSRILDIIVEVSGVFHLSPLWKVFPVPAGAVAVVTCSIPNKSTSPREAVLIEVYEHGADSAHRRIVIHNPPFSAATRSSNIGLPENHRPPSRCCHSSVFDCGRSHWEDELRAWIQAILLGPNPNVSLSEDETVLGIIADYRNHVESMDFKVVIEHLALHAELSWFMHNQNHSSSLLAASTRNVALMQLLQQLGHHEQAHKCFNDLLIQLRINPRDLTELYKVLDETTADDAMSVYFRLHPASLGSDACGENLETALTTLKLPRNRSKFFWRQHAHTLAAGRSFDWGTFERRYRDLTDGGVGGAMGNMSGVRGYAALREANCRPASKTGIYLEEAIRYAKEGRSRVEEMAGDNPKYPHLITHTILGCIRYEVALRQSLEACRNVTKYSRDLQIIAADINYLGEDAEVRADADGQRESMQMIAKLLGERAVAARSNTGQGLIQRRREASLGLQERLNRLCRRVDALD